MSYVLVNQNPVFNPEPYFKTGLPKSILETIDPLDFKYTDLFDQNGYDLTEIEKLYCKANDDTFESHREHRFAIKKLWYKDYILDPSDPSGPNTEFSIQRPSDPKGPGQRPCIGQRPMQGCVINHCYLFERKGYTGEALLQLKSFAKQNPLFYKVINIRPKWGIDFSLDYIGSDGSEEPLVFEVFHYEWDSFSYEEANKMKQRVEKVIESTDWEAAAKELMKRKNDPDGWGHLSFFEQSDWKCRFFGLPSEQFKMVTWE